MSGAGAVFGGGIGVPAPALRRMIDRYNGYRIEGAAPGLHQGLPSRYLTVIVSLGEPVDIAVMPDPAERPRRFAALVGGLHDTAATIRHDGNQHGIHVGITPLGARALLGFPAGALAGTVVDLADVLGPRAHELLDRLASTSGWSQRFAVLDEILAAAVVEAPDPAPEVRWAWRRLIATGGSIPVAALTREVGWSPRRLGDRFRAEFGLSPKVAARVLRMERARRLLELPQRPSLAEVAAVCGYYDQAHLNRDWRALAGCTPTAWLADELRSVQDERGRAGAHSAT